jgi:hypothetical protein
MSAGSGLPGEARFLEWAHRRAYESRVGPRLHALESGVPYGSAVLVYALLGALALKRPPGARLIFTLKGLAPSS